MDENTPTQKFPFAILQHNLKQKKRGLTLHGARLTKYCTHSSLWLQNAQTHQAPKHVTFTEAKALQWVPVEHLQWSFEQSSWMRAGFIQINMGRCWPLQRSTLVLQSFETQRLNEGIILVSTAHQKTVRHLRLQLSCCGVKGPLMSKRTRPWLYAFPSSMISSARSPLSLWCPNLLCKAMAYFVD